MDKTISDDVEAAFADWVQDYLSDDDIPLTIRYTIVNSLKDDRRAFLVDYASWFSDTGHEEDDPEFALVPAGCPALVMESGDDAAELFDLCDEMGIAVTSQHYPSYGHRLT